MRFHWEPAPRVPRPPVWAAVLVGSWLLLVLGGVLLESWGAPALETCLLQRLSGHACPTCGSTRVVLGLVHGDWLNAIRLNPLVALGLLMGAAVLGVRGVFGRVLRADFSSRERRTVLILGVGALLANWVWVLRSQG